MNADRQYRHGFSLIEMLVVLTAGSVLLAVAVGILAILLRVEQTGREHGQQVIVLGRLAAQFREDAHAAEQLLAGETGQKDQWRFALGPDRAVTYRVTAAAVQRDEAAAGRPVRHESYPLPPGCTARQSLSADRAVASLTVAPAEMAAVGNREMRIDVVVGRDRRFVHVESGGR